MEHCRYLNRRDRAFQVSASTEKSHTGCEKRGARAKGKTKAKAKTKGAARGRAGAQREEQTDVVVRQALVERRPRQEETRREKKERKAQRGARVENQQSLQSGGLHSRAKGTEAARFADEIYLKQAISNQLSSSNIFQNGRANPKAPKKAQHQKTTGAQKHCEDVTNVQPLEPCCSGDARGQLFVGFVDRPDRKLRTCRLERLRRESEHDFRTKAEIKPRSFLGDC